MTTTNARTHPFAAQLQEHGYHLHGLAALFPPMQPDEFEALKESIRQNGQREPALLFGSLLLDGVHRVRACIELGIEPKIVKVAGTGAELRSRVLDLNLHRRHLTTGQRAMIAADLAQRRPGEGGNADDAAPTQAEAAAMMSVGERSVRQAKRIAAEAAPEVVEGVRTGEVTLNAAAGMMERSGPNGRQVEEEPPEEAEVETTVDGHDQFSVCRQCTNTVPLATMQDYLCVGCQEANEAIYPPAEEPTYIYECSMCGDELQEDEVAWLEELPCCPTCFAQADPGDDPDDEEETEPRLPDGWEWDGRYCFKKMGDIRYRAFSIGKEFEWDAVLRGEFSVRPLMHRGKTLELACAAAEDWHRVWIVAAHGEQAPNALIDTPAAYSAVESAYDTYLASLDNKEENEFMGEMAAGESMDDVVGV